MPKLKLYNIYIAEISYFKGNPTHKAIIKVINDIKGYEEILIFTSEGNNCAYIKNLNYFNLVQEINLK